MAFVIRPIVPAGRPSFRPQSSRSRKPDVRANTAAQTPSGTSGTAAPAPSGSGFPVALLPVMLAAAAMPIYGYQTQMKLINEARAKHAASQAAEKAKKA
ncbi:hypothetical protein HYH03_015480 [Edaphochlamys debaryana]|uniref:Uncharacterized protein n=1 Tax=Edaphochlamys debaryana TaxID=47281 RepID=A0A835XP62_9CHLO|nr:hypothetical protein HYH03_015480 [Edaphochlamys debaryana]|eukprot:KAG2485766.1 hypothetical protein HYH03_015480 [Edaphochlamys debaryana]